MRALSLSLALCLPLASQAPKPADYSARTRLASVEIGAKYLPQGLPSGSGVSAGRKFLVVDVGIFPEAKNGLSISKSQFSLSVDGKPALAAQTPGTGSSGSLTAAHDSSTSDSAVQLGGPPIPTPSGNKPRELESMPRRPISLDPEQSSAPARKAALPEGFTNKPVSGYLFFRFDGDPKSIRSLELTYTDAGGAKAKIRIP